MREKYKFDTDYYFEGKQRSFQTRLKRVEASFNLLKTDKDRYEALARDAAVAVFWKTPSKRAIKDLFFRYREAFRYCLGKGPDHLQDLIVTHSPVYIGWFDTLNVAQQHRVIKTDPYQVYRFSKMFEPRVLDAINPELRSKIQALGSLGLEKEDFNAKIKEFLETAPENTVKSESTLNL